MWCTLGNAKSVDLNESNHKKLEQKINGLGEKIGRDVSRRKLLFIRSYIFIVYTYRSRKNKNRADSNGTTVK